MLPPLFIRNKEQLKTIYSELFNNLIDGRTISEKNGTRYQVFKSFLILNKLMKYNKYGLWRNNDELLNFYTTINTKLYKTNNNYIVYYFDYGIYALYFNNYLVSFFNNKDFTIYIFEPEKRTNNKYNKTVLNNIKAFKEILNNNILFLNLEFIKIINDFKLY